MSAADEERWLREYLAGADSPDARLKGADCLDDEALANLADGATEESVRASQLVHVAECARCREAVASIARAITDPSLTRESIAAKRATTFPWRRIAIPAAAAALLLVIMRLPPSRVADDAHRSTTVTEAASPRRLSPAGVVSRAEVLRWNSVTGADRYRVTLFDGGGRIIYEHQLTDTIAQLPDSLELAVDRKYFWSVEARSGWNRWSSSQLTEFSIASPRRR